MEEKFKYENRQYAFRKPESVVRAAMVTVGRKRLGMSRKELAEKVGCKVHTIRMIEAGRTNSMVETLDKIGEELNLQLTYTFKI